MDAVSETVLVERLKGGDAAALETLMERYASRVFRVARGITRTDADAEVWALTLTPDRSRVVVGGQFTTLNGAGTYGMGAVDAASGSVAPWAANQEIRNAGDEAAITSLSTDGTNVLGTAYSFTGGGNFEGSFAANPGTGAIAWMNDCQGDSYDVFARIHGGGVSGQAGALRLGVARSLNEADAEHNRPTLKKAGFLTRDARATERKKYGLKKARKAPQYSQR